MSKTTLSDQIPEGNTNTWIQRSKTILQHIGPSIISLLLAMVFAMVIMITSDHPVKNLRSFFLSPIVNPFYLGNLLDYAGYLMLTGLGSVIAFRSGSFNLGGEGQSYIGGFVATIFLLWLGPGFGPLGIILALILAMFISGILGRLSGILKKKLDIPELLSSFLISMGLIPILDNLIGGPLRDSSSNFLGTAKIELEYQFSRLLLPSRLNLGFILVLVFIISLAILLQRHRIGYSMKIVGANPILATIQGIPAPKMAILAFTLSAALHGLAGSMAVLGTYHASFVGFSFGFGWNGIAVALIAKNRPFAVIPAALIFSYLTIASQSAMVTSNFPFEFSSLIQGLVFFTITFQFVWSRKKTRRQSAS